jgi:hypothetical protein
MAADSVLQQPSLDLALKDGLGLSLNALGGDVPRKRRGIWAVLRGGCFVIV